MADDKTIKPVDDKAATVAKDVAQKPAEPAPKVKDTGATVEPAMALNRINGTIEPGTPFRPPSAQDRADLLALNAIRDLTEAEALLFAKIEQPADPLG